MLKFGGGFIGKEPYSRLPKPPHNMQQRPVLTHPARPRAMGCYGALHGSPSSRRSIFSKKYMETPPELKGEKQKHNVRTLKKMAEMMVRTRRGCLALPRVWGCLFSFSLSFRLAQTRKQLNYALINSHSLRGCSRCHFPPRSRGWTYVVKRSEIVSFSSSGKKILCSSMSTREIAGCCVFSVCGRRVMESIAQRPELRTLLDANLASSHISRKVSYEFPRHRHHHQHRPPSAPEHNPPPPPPSTHPRVEKTPVCRHRRFLSRKNIIKKKKKSEGGQFIWVAPSGGRDRPDPETGKFVVSPYDPKSVEVFRLMAAKAMGRDKAGPVTHFFPFAMWTNKLVPPPDQVCFVPCCFCFGLLVCVYARVFVSLSLCVSVVCVGVFNVISVGTPGSYDASLCALLFFVGLEWIGAGRPSAVTGGLADGKRRRKPVGAGRKSGLESFLLRTFIKRSAEDGGRVCCITSIDRASRLTGE